MSDVSAGSSTIPRRIAGLISGLQALALLACAGWYVYEVVALLSPKPAVSLMAAVTIAVFAVGLAVLARAWWRAAPRPRTPTIVWNALLLLSTWTVTQGWGTWVAVAIALPALAALVAALLAREGDAFR